ncbi:MAG: FAD-dependent oxidoreductase, partial [bacterium]
GAYARLLGIPMEVLESVYEGIGLSSNLDAAREAFDHVAIRETDCLLDNTAGETIPVQTLPIDTIPITGHIRDIRTELKTGSWSALAPRYSGHKAPCNVACPAGNDIVGFIHALKQSGPESAARILLETQPLPSVCGRVCPAPCMTGCNRSAFDGAVNIRGLERRIADHADSVSPTIVPDTKTFRVAIAGGGPAGLSAAYQMARRGHTVTIYDAHPSLGGVLYNGIPAYRLPHDVLQRDIDRILSLGITAVCGKKMGSDDMEALARDNDALVIATGFGASTRLGVAGEGLPEVEQGLDFLERNKQQPEAVAGNVLVAGGGNTAIDCARTALRCGAVSVTLAYRRGREEMPAINEEIEAALAEGVVLQTHRQPMAIRGDSSVRAVILAEVELGEPDESGRRRPIVTDRTAEIACDRVLLALGQQTGVDFLPDSWTVRNARAWADDQLLPVWFAGDCATMAGTVTHAIGNGRRVAEALLDEQSGKTKTSGASPDIPVVTPEDIRLHHFPAAPPTSDRNVPIAEARHSFSESNLGLQDVKEAERCFSCGQCTQCDTCMIFCPEAVIKRVDGTYQVDEDYCKGCGMCVAECPRNVMEMTSKKGEEYANAS